MSLVIGGVASLVLAVVPLHTGDGRQIPVPPDTAVPLPEPGLFGGSMVLYGVLAESAPRPGEGDLGCVHTGPSGRPIPIGVNTLDALGADDREVGGTSLTPLATVALSARSTLTCSGPASRSAQPIYLLAERRRTVPRVFAASSGVMALAMGVGALVLLRARRSGPGRLNP